jgi:hypothetical protein
MWWGVGGGFHIRYVASSSVGSVCVQAGSTDEGGGERERGEGGHEEKECEVWGDGAFFDERVKDCFPRTTTQAIRWASQPNAALARYTPFPARRPKPNHFDRHTSFIPTTSTKEGESG